MGLDLFGIGAPTAYTDAMHQVTGAVTDLAYADAPVHSRHTLADLRILVDAVDLTKPLPALADVIAETSLLYGEHAVYYHRPGYLSHLNCPVTLPGVAADAFTAALNTAIETWDQSRAGTLIERRLIETLGGWLGFPACADGVFTSGGTQSNLQAMVMARGHACHEAFGIMGLDNMDPTMLSRLRVFHTSHTHYSIRKAVGIMGLGVGSMVEVDATPDGAMCPDALAAALHRTRLQRNVPMAVISTAGTTDAGVLDNLAAIADICQDDGVWWHVDAAVGGVLAISDRTRGRLAGIEHADSVTVDFHKTFFQPVACSAVAVRNEESLRHIACYADYLNPEDDPFPNQANKSLHTTRRFDALKMWMTLRAYGTEPIADAFTACERNAVALHQMLTDHPQLEAYAPPQLNMVLFRYVPSATEQDTDRLDQLNLSIRRELMANGEFNIASTTVDGQCWLKITLLNPATSTDQLASAVAGIATVGAELNSHLAESSQRLELLDPRCEATL